MIDKLLSFAGAYLIILGVVIVLLGYTWQIVKPLVEKSELQYIKEIKKLEKLEG